MNAPGWIDNLSDADLRILAYICGQAEGRQEDNGCYLNGQPGMMAAQVQAKAKRREKAQRVALTNPVTGRTAVTLQAGPL